MKYLTLFLFLILVLFLLVFESDAKECNAKVFKRFDECLNNSEFEHKKCLALFGDNYCLKRLESFVDACIDTANVDLAKCKKESKIKK